MYLRFSLSCILFLCAVTYHGSHAQDLGNGFYDYGVACPESNHRGVVATTGEGGKNVALAWLFDHRGGYGLLSVDALTGATKQFDLPFPSGDAPYASILSSDNKFYGYFNNHFSEFDPVENEFIFSQKAFDLTAMTFTEDDNGLIWAATYPNCGLVSYNPKTKELINHGFINTEAWRQYPRSIATDAEGWVYVGVGSTESQIIAFNPNTKEIRKLLEGTRRQKGWPLLYRSLDGSVYGNASREAAGKKISLSKGVATFTSDEFSITNERPQITGDQTLFYKEFKDGSVIKNIDFGKKELVVVDKGAETKLNFEYKSEGSLVMAVDVTSKGKLIGGTAFPMRFFEFDPTTTQFKNYNAYGQFNTSTSTRKYIYFGSYPYGALVRYDVEKPVSDDTKQPNPKTLGADKQNIHRPHRVLALDKLNRVLLAGTPEYGFTGGGMLIYNSKGDVIQKIVDTMLVLDQSTMSMTALDNNLVLCGTTVAPGTGGLKKADEAILYIFDAKELRPTWKKNILQGVQTYSDLMKVGNVVYGIADNKQFFVFDPIKRTVIYKETIPEAMGNVVTVQSPRVFTMNPSTGECYLICRKGILKVDKSSFKLETVAVSPIMIEAGGAFYNNKLYFISGSHLCSYQLK